MKYGYARVSTKDQNEARQIDALNEVPVDRIFLDKMSGRNFKRPEWNAMIMCLEKGDTLYIPSLDRMGRNYEEIQEQWRFIVNDIGADIVIMDMSMLDTRRKWGGNNGLTGRFISDIVLQVLAYVSQIEREKTKERQAQGIAAAMARGVKFGRPALELPDNFDEVCSDCYTRKIKCAEAAKLLGMKEGTFNAKYYEWKNNNLALLIRLGGYA